MGRKGIPVAFKSVSVLSGFACFMMLFGIFQPLAILFGVHALSLTIIVVSGFICIATGSKAFGKLGDYVNKPAILLVAILSVLILFLIFHNVLRGLISNGYSSLLQKYSLQQFGDGLLTFLLSFTFLFIPLVALGGSWSLLFRLFIKNIDHTGKYMASAVFWISSGMFLGIMVTILTLSSLGVNNLLFISAFLFMIVLVIVVLWTGSVRKRDYHSPYVTRIEKAKKSIRFKKKRIVLEAGVKLTRALLNGYAFQLFAFFSLLIVGYRLLIPYNKIHQPYFALLFIAVVFVSIGLGTILYRLIAEKPANNFMTLATLQVFSGFSCLLSVFSLKIIPAVLPDAPEASYRISEVIMQQVLLLSVFLLIPSVIQGMSIPLAGKLYPKRLPYIGKTFGKLGSMIVLSFCSALIIAPNILVPVFGLYFAFFGIALLILLSGIYLISRDSRVIRFFRIGYAFVAIALFVITALVLQSKGDWRRDAAVKICIEGRTSTVVGRENRDSSYSVFLNGEYYFGTGMHSKNEQLKSAVLPLLLYPGIKSALVDGFGTGITAHLLDDSGLSTISITEAFPEIIKLSPDIFSPVNNDVLTSARVNISTEDARSYLFRSLRAFDLITSGINQYNRFPGQYTDAFYELCFNRLTETGVLCQVIPVEMIARGELKPVCKSAALAFEHISLWYLSPHKLMLMASKKPLEINYCRINENRYNRIFESADHMISHLIMTNAEIDVYIKDADERTDNFLFPEFYDGKHQSSDIDYIRQIEPDYAELITFDDGCPDTAEAINRIYQLNRSLLQQVSPFSAARLKQVVDFSEWPVVPIQQYL